MAYAAGTTVNVSASQQEIAKTLHRYGVETYSFGARPGEALVEFEMNRYPVRIMVPLPPKPPKQMGPSPESGRQINLWSRWEQELKEAWRALLLLIKANLEAIERGIVTVEQAFLAYLVGADGRTVGEAIIPSIQDAQKAITA